MIPYYLLFIFTFLASCTNICSKTSLSAIRKSIYILFAFSTFFCFYLFTCCKGNVGTDYFGYYDIYTNIGTLNFSKAKHYVEPVFWFVSRLFNLYNLPFPMFWFFIASITLSTKFIFIKKLSPYFFLSILIYLSGLFIERDFDGIRQGLSIGFAYMAILQYIKNKKSLFYILLLVSICSHYSSLVFLFIPILSKINIRRSLVYFLVFFGFLFILINVDIVAIVLKIMPKGYILTKLNNYYNSKFGGNIGLNIGIIVRILVLLLFGKINPNEIKMDIKTYNLLFNGFLLSILFFCFFNNIEIIAHRLAYGFREFQIIIIPICFKYYVMDKKILKDFKILSFFVYVIYAFLLFYRIINSAKLRGYYEYSFIFTSNPFLYIK